MCMYAYVEDSKHKAHLYQNWHLQPYGYLSMTSC